MPARQRGAVLDDAASRPQDAPLVHRSRDIIVGTQDVEVTGLQPLQHKCDCLLGRPGPCWFLRAAAGRQGREHKPWDEQMGRDAAALGVAQFVRRASVKAWPASATQGAPAYPLRDRTGIQAESFARNPYETSPPSNTACTVAVQPFI